MSGVALVAEGGEIVYEGGIGLASAEHEVANTPGTRFRIASITKVFTAIVVLRLAEANLLDLDRPIGEHIDGLRGDLADRVTPRQLLEHRSGLDREYLPPDADLARDYSLRELLRSIDQNTGWVAEPGATVSYSNAGFVLLAALVENVTGRPFAAAVRDHILEPLGLRDTGFEQSSSAVIPKLATGYRVRLGIRIRAERGGMSWTRGNGGIYSTARDLWRLDRALRDGSLLSEASTKLMFSQGEKSFAIVWQVGDPPTGYPRSLGRLAWARGANPGGYRSQWMRQLDGDRVVILLTNLDFAPRHQIAGRIFSLLLGEEVELPTSPLSHWLYRRLNEEGLGPA
ncbi:MAG: beta-lactamase family protein, partial [Holophagales bacterium]|nr:beta-lactamase family protein [Holophagales bacterium]